MQLVARRCVGVVHNIGAQLELELRGTGGSASGRGLLGELAGDGGMGRKAASLGRSR